MYLQEMGGRLWRNREASCNALSDLLQGRRWPELKEKLRDIWTMTLRAADDIKESVRGAATILGKTLRNLTLRLCDPQITPTKEAQEAVGLALPLLLEQGKTSEPLLFRSSWQWLCVLFPAVFWHTSVDA